MAKDTFRVPLHLEAPTMRELTRLCFQNNRINDKMFEYQVFHDGKNYVAVFHASLSDYIPLSNPTKDKTLVDPGDR